MKKILLFTIAIALILGCFTCLFSCSAEPTPELDFKKAERELQNCDFETQLYYDDECELPGAKKFLIASKKSENIMIIEFKTKEAAELYYKTYRDDKEYQTKKIQSQINWLEYALDEFASEFSRNEREDTQNKIDDYKKQLKELNKLTVGIKGIKVWVGTDFAIEYSKQS